MCRSFFVAPPNATRNADMLNFVHGGGRRTKKRNATAAHSSAGFTLLLAALVASLVLSLGIAIFSIAQKSVTLSTLGRDSQFAFYAADTAAECALYWDIRHQLFSTTSPPTQITCDSPPNTDSAITTLGAWPPMTFSFQYEPNGYCAQVLVTKNDVNPKTTIHADGFSTRCADIGSTNSRALQRSVELHY